MRTFFLAVPQLFGDGSWGSFGGVNRYLLRNTKIYRKWRRSRVLGNLDSVDGIMFRVDVVSGQESMLEPARSADSPEPSDFKLAPSLDQKSMLTSVLPRRSTISKIRPGTP